MKGRILFLLSVLGVGFAILMLAIFFGVRYPSWYGVSDLPAECTNTGIIVRFRTHYAWADENTEKILMFAPSGLPSTTLATVLKLTPRITNEIFGIEFDLLLFNQQRYYFQELVKLQRAEKYFDEWLLTGVRGPRHDCYIQIEQNKASFELRELKAELWFLMFQFLFVIVFIVIDMVIYRQIFVKR